MIAKSDQTNRDKFAASFPAEVEAVKIFKEHCPYVSEAADDGTTLNKEPDWNTINEWAHLATEKQIGPLGTASQGKISEDDQGDLKFYIGADSKNNVVRIDFGKSISWFGLDKDTAEQFAIVLLKNSNLLKLQNKEQV